MTPADWFIVNVEAVICRDDRYLMIMRGEEESHAAGTLSLVGGKVDNLGNVNDVLEINLRREIMEEVGVEVGEQMTYIRSSAFIGDDGDPVVDIVFLCEWLAGEGEIYDPGEVAEIRWLNADDILNDDTVPLWTKASIIAAEHVRANLT